MVFNDDMKLQNLGDETTLLNGSPWALVPKKVKCVVLVAHGASQGSKVVPSVRVVYKCSSFNNRLWAPASPENFKMNGRTQQSNSRRIMLQQIIP